MLLDFRDYIAKKKLVKEKYVPYYLKWVSSCYSFLNKPDSQVLSQARKQEFLKHLSKSHEDWQVNQADDALALRRGRFLYVPAWEQ